MKTQLSNQLAPSMLSSHLQADVSVDVKVEDMSTQYDHGNEQQDQESVCVVKVEDTPTQYDTGKKQQNVCDVKAEDTPKQNDIAKEQQSVCNVKAKDTPIKYVDRITILNQLLRSFGHKGEYSFGGPAPQLPTSGLYVKKIGWISLPVQSAQAALLKRVMVQAPFGRNLETLVDREVRDSWQLDPANFKLYNSSFHKAVCGMMPKIAERLGFGYVALQPIIHKMLMYENGGHFGRHRDTEKEKGTFATMVVQLPSVHEGGSLVVYRGEQKFVHSFGAAEDGKRSTAPFACHYAVHYTDAEHELLPVTKGYRLVLVYSICFPPNVTPPIITEKDAIEPLIATNLEAMSKEGAFKDHFSYMFQHQYTESTICNFGVNALKGTDRFRCELLQRNSQGHFQFYLCQMEKVEKKYVEDGYDSDFGCDYGSDSEMDWYSDDQEVKVNSWYTCDGKHLIYGDSGEMTCYDLLENSLNPDNLEEEELWGDHDSSDYEGYYGNEGATKTRVYVTCALVAWPSAKDILYRAMFMGKNALQQSFASMTKEEACAAVQLLVRELPKKPVGIGLYSQNWKIEESLRKYLLQKIIEFEDFQSCSVFLDRFGGDAEQLVMCLNAPFPWADSEKIFVNCLEKIRDPVDTCLRILSGMSSKTNMPLVRNHIHKILAPVVHEYFAGTPGVVALKYKTRLPADIAKDEQLMALFLEQCVGASVSNVLKIVDDLIAVLPIVSDANKATIIRLFGTLAEDYERKVNAPQPPFSWTYPEATFSQRKDLQDFLRGTQQTMVFAGFTSIRDARQTAGVWESSLKKYSLAFRPEGTGKRAHIRISKTRALHEKREQQRMLLGRKAGVLRAVIAAHTSLPVLPQPSGETASCPQKRPRTPETIVLD